MISSATPRQGRESGMVLVAALLVMAMLSILAVAGVGTSTLEVKIAAHDRDAKQAFYLAEAGLIRTQYEIVKGWGKGTVAGTVFTFDAPTVAPAALAWAEDKWNGFRLRDSRGVDDLVLDTDATSGVTCLGPASLASGSAHFYYRQGPPTTATGTAAGSVVTVSPSLGWTDHEWEGCWGEIGGTLYDVTDNTVDTLTLSPTPPAGAVAVDLVRGRPELKQLCRPNLTWTTTNLAGGVWYLVSDAAPNQRHRIESATGGPRFDLTITATPASGPFELVTNPWLMANQGAGRNPFTAPLVAPSTIPYGTPLVDVTETPSGSGSFVLAARSATQTITIDARLGAGGGVSFSNWRQGP